MTKHRPVHHGFSNRVSQLLDQPRVSLHRILHVLNHPCVTNDVILYDLTR